MLLLLNSHTGNIIIIYYYYRIVTLVPQARIRILINLRIKPALNLVVWSANPTLAGYNDMGVVMVIMPTWAWPEHI